MKGYILTLTFAVITLNIFAQKGSLKGKITDEKTGEEIIGGVVMISGTTTATVSDFEGNYELPLQAGVYTIEVRFIGYDILKKEGVEIKPNQVTPLNFKLSIKADEIMAVDVVIKQDRENSVVLLAERKDAAVMVENIGVREMNSKGASNVAAGVSKISGVSRVSSGVSVRGLGDRYNNAYLNGLPLPSPDPNFKVIDLSLFPSSVVRNIDVTKVYTADQYADMAGAAIDIKTIDATEEDFASVNYGIGLNTQTTFKKFLISKDGASNFFGISGKGRQEPQVDLETFKIEDNGVNQPFGNGFDPSSIKAPLESRFGFQFGKQFKGENSKLGFVFTSNYMNNYRYDIGKNDILNKDQVADNYFTRERYAFGTSLTNFLGAEYSFKNKHFINLNYIFLNGSENSYVISTGNTDEDDSQELFDTKRFRSRYLERRLNDIQLAGKHNISETSTFAWGTSVAFANTDEPGRKDLSFTTAEGDAQFGTFTKGGGGENQRYFQYTNEKEFSGYLKYIKGWGESHSEKSKYKHNIEFGYQTRLKNRDVNFTRYFLLSKPSILNAKLDITNLDAVFTDEAYYNKDYYYTVLLQGSNFSKAKRNINAFYTLINFNPSPSLTITPALRLEYTNQVIYSKLEGSLLDAPFVETPNNGLNLLPSLNMKKALSEKDALRASASKTMVRPNFQELIPVAFENENIQAFVGNARLVNSTAYNLDLKYENYAKVGQLLSAGVFYKYIDKPIEQIRPDVNFISYFNVSNANIIGTEFEFKKRLIAIDDTNKRSALTQGFYYDGNLSLMYSRISLNDADLLFYDPITAYRLKNVTNKNRALQGASPVIFNATIGNDAKWFKNSEESNIGFTYNIFGRRIFSAGTQKRGDEYELAYGTLDFILQNTWKNGLSVRFTARNLLNPKIQFMQEAGPEATYNVITQSFQTGRTFNLLLTYRVGSKG